MTTTQFLLVYGLSLVTMLVCRCVPLFALKGRELSEATQSALNFIPPAAFAALVANDLFSPGMFDAGWWPALLPMVASLAVVVAARTTRSLIVCALVGVAAYALLMLV